MKTASKSPPFFMLLMLLLLVFTQLIYSINFVKCSPSTQLSISPQSIIVVIDTNFTVAVKLSNAPSFKQFSIALKYNTTALNAWDIQVLVPSPHSSYIDEVDGTIKIDAWDQNLEGNQTLATIYFKAIGKGNTTIEFYGSEIRDQSWNLILHEVVDGQVEIIGHVGLTVTTDNSYHYLGNNMTIYGNLTMDGVYATSLIGIEIHTLEDITLIRTTKSGYIPPYISWPVEVLNFYPSDDQGNPKNSFSAGYQSYFTVEVMNHANEMLPILVTVNAFDKYNSPFGLTIVQTSIPPSTSQMHISPLLIPSQTSNGTALAYLNVFSDWPRNEGFPYHPEESASFQIIDGTTSIPPASPPSNQTCEANYNLTFKLISTGGLTNFEVYATTLYKDQNKQAQTSFIALAIELTDISLSKTIVGRGNPMRIYVKIVNYGSNTQTFNLTVSYNSTILNTKPIMLEGKSFTTITFWWNTTAVDAGNYTITAYASHVEGEVNMTINELTDGIVNVSPLIGDFNSDGKVGPYDFTILAISYGSQPSSPKWYPNADFNEDDKIGPYDFTLFSINYFTHL